MSCNTWCCILLQIYLKPGHQTEVHSLQIQSLLLGICFFCSQADYSITFLRVPQIHTRWFLTSGSVVLLSHLSEFWHSEVLSIWPIKSMGFIDRRMSVLCSGDHLLLWSHRRLIAILCSVIKHSAWERSEKYIHEKGFKCVFCAAENSDTFCIQIS